MASRYILMVAVCVLITTGSPQFTLSTDKKSWSDAREACAGNNSSLVTTYENNTQIDNLLQNTSLWTSKRTFLSGWVAYQGCHMGNLTDIRGQTVTSPKVARCQLHCQANGSQYFSLQGTMCKCLNISVATQLNRTHDSRCNVTCGKGQENGTKCGGWQQHVVSLYRISGFQRHDKQKIICEKNSGYVTCPNHTVINITYANYGLTKEIEKCESNKYLPSNKNCRHARSSEIMMKSCNGRQTCNVTASNDFFGSDPCILTTKLLNISYTCVREDSERDLCRIFRLDANSVKLQAIPCNSKVDFTACTIYNETERKDSLDIFTHTGTWENAVNRVCSKGYISTTDNITDMELQETAELNVSIWSGYIRQRVDVNDSDVDLEGSSFVRCYARENETITRLNCTEERQYICQKEVVAEEPTQGPNATTDTAPGGNGGPSPTGEGVAEKPTQGPNATTDTAPGGNGGPFSGGAFTTMGKTETTTPSTTTPRGTGRVTLPRPRDSSREDSKIIGIASGITVGCIVLVAVTAIVVDRVCKRSAKRKRQKKKKPKEKPMTFIGNVINAQNVMDSVDSEASSDESENESKTAAGTSSSGAEGAKPLPSVSYNYDIVNEVGTDNGHVDGAYAYATTNQADSEEADYDAMELCVIENDEDHIYAHTMLPLPDMENDATDVVAKQTDGEAYDVMQSNVKTPGNDSAYDHTEGFSKGTRTTADEGYDMFNGKVKDDQQDTYDHTQGVLHKNGDASNTMYDVFSGKVKGDEEISDNMYDHTKNVHQGEIHISDVSANNIYDTCNDKAKVVDDVDDMYDHTTHVRENQDENLYDLTSKRTNDSYVDKNHYDQM